METFVEGSSHLLEVLLAFKTILAQTSNPTIGSSH